MTRVSFSCAVEGELDEAVARRLVEHVGADLGLVYGKQGKPFLLDKGPAWNQAARRNPWLVLIDQDADARCPGAIVAEVLTRRAPLMCFRVAVREVEAWLMADRANFAKALQVPRQSIPANPELELDPKATVVALARRSQSARITREMVPSATGGRAIGPAYNSVLARFAIESWSPEGAALVSLSLARALKQLKVVAALAASGSAE
ncbi:MAG: hypothetical protein ACKVS8_00110 [Phycisphaerales bacterium]